MLIKVLVFFLPIQWKFNLRNSKLAVKPSSKCLLLLSKGGEVGGGGVIQFWNDRWKSKWQNFLFFTKLTLLSLSAESSNLHKRALIIHYAEIINMHLGHHWNSFNLFYWELLMLPLNESAKPLSRVPFSGLGDIIPGCLTLTTAVDIQKNLLSPLFTSRVLFVCVQAFGTFGAFS